MNAANTELEETRAPSDVNGTNGLTAPAGNEQPVHQFQLGLGDHPLWQEFMDIMKANREADIAEANRIADLELESSELEK